MIIEIYIFEGKMKKLYLFILILFINLNLFAQDKGDIKFGVFTGPSYSGITGDDFDDEKDDLEDSLDEYNDYDNTEAKGYMRGRFGFHIGVKGEYFISEFISVGVSPYYSQKGFNAKLSLDSDGDELNYELKTKLDYLSLPLNITYYLDNDFFLFAGLSTNLLIADKVEEYSEDITDGDTDTDRETDDYDDFTGEDLEKSISGMFFGVGLSLDKAFLNIKFHNTSEWQERDEDYANFTTSLSLGLNF